MDEALQEFKPGDTLEVEVQRGEEKITVRSEIGT
jgi:hypothetical protein